jgi:two-component system CAI-1 autoinducer sensor kinase/phosphatase CqsS
MFIPIVLSNYWSVRMRRFKVVYWNLVILFTLPFFFTFMLLKNDLNYVWVTSLLTAIFIMISMLNWQSLVFHSMVGGLLACLAYFVDEGMIVFSLAYINLEFLPLVLFLLISGVATNYGKERIQAERERAILDAASSIAHELRTPLLGISAGAAGLRNYVPVLVQAYHFAQKQGGNLPFIRAAHLNAMVDVLKRIETESRHANTMVDMLLVSARGGRALQEYKECSMQECIAEMLQRYPFETGERELVHTRVDQDFMFRANELQVVHVLFNLIKNALRHIHQAGKGEIMISINADQDKGRLIFRDTGTGIAPDVLPHIFKRFYTTQLLHNKTDNWGAGIGLAFCQDVVKSLGGEIKCRSAWQEFTEFEIIFPSIQHQEKGN